MQSVWAHIIQDQPQSNDAILQNKGKQKNNQMKVHISAVIFKQSHQEPNEANLFFSLPTPF